MISSLSFAMADMKVWTILLVLISLHGNSDSQTFMTVTMVTTEIMGTAPSTFRTTPPPPPPSITPPPPSTSVEPPTPEPPITTRIPPPPPPPSPPPPPPSSTIPPSPTPSTTSTTSTRILTTTVAIQPTQAIETTRKQTEPIIEPNPVAETLGKIGVLLTVAPDQFDRQQFKDVMAQEVNNYCTEFTGQCVGEGKTVSAKDVVIISAESYEQPVGDGAKRRLLQGDQILVEYYVQDPILSTNVMLTTEQQRVFLANEDVNNALQSNIDGYNGIAPVYAEPIEYTGLEGWEIALIVIGSVAAVGLVIGAVAFHMSYNKANGKHVDLELQETKTATVMEHTSNDYSAVVTNGLSKAKVKPSVDEIDVATQVKYKDIVNETGFQAVKGERKEEDKPNGGTPLIVTAEIVSSSSDSSTSSDHGEIDATAEEQQEIPPDYEPPQPFPAVDSGPKEFQEEVAQAVTELDKLVASQRDQLTVNSAAFKNPGFLASTEASTHSG